MPILIFLSLLLAPAYTHQFIIGNFPSNLLMVWIFLIWLIFFIYIFTTNQISKFYIFIRSLNLSWLVGLFFLSGIISLFVFGLNQKSLGQLLVLFIQPISLFFIFKFIFEKNPNSKRFIPYTLYLILCISGLYAIIQYFTGFNLPLLFQGNDVETRRAVSFFTHSNFYALFTAPLLAFLIPDLSESIKNKNSYFKLLKIFAWLTAAIGLLLSFSRAGWIGLFVSIILYALIAGDKKIKATILWLSIVLIILTVLTPSLKNRLTAPFKGEKSSSSRITLWQSGIKAIKQSPIFGLGLTGYKTKYDELISDKTLAKHNYPHNIFLNLWVETGLLGLIAFTSIILISIYKGLKDKSNILKLSVALFLITFLVQGQLDNPYFKNDLAVVFWMILSLI